MREKRERRKTGKGDQQKCEIQEIVGTGDRVAQNPNEEAAHQYQQTKAKEGTIRLLLMTTKVVEYSRRDE